MRLRSLVATIALLFAASIPVLADTITTFQLSGVLAHGNNSGLASGFVDIDTTAGIYTAADITVIDTLGTFTFTTLDYAVVNSTVFAEYLVTTHAFFTLVTPGTSLVGFNGSPLCTSVARADCTAADGATYYSSNLVPSFDFDSVISGQLIPVATPEPPGLLLMATGFLGAAHTALRRRSAPKLKSL